MSRLLELLRGGAPLPPDLPRPTLPAVSRRTTPAVGADPVAEAHAAVVALADALESLLRNPVVMEALGPLEARRAQAALARARGAGL
jgi:hypothetical protein